ncbi:MAG: tRNA 2-thiocytidine(32) synthetase TtcA, partial [Hydrogenophaga sp.]|nr:tRNA 2-thiocytidine(32) synthetase TtcA [Hydrogenophaga sp.]
QRKQVGLMLKDWEKRFPGRVENMFSALQNIVPSHLMDRSLFPFQTIRATGEASEDGDKAFDDEPLPVVAPPSPEESDTAGNASRARTVIAISTAH